MTDTMNTLHAALSQKFDMDGVELQHPSITFEFTPPTTEAADRGEAWLKLSGIPGYRDGNTITVGFDTIVGVEIEDNLAVVGTVLSAMKPTEPEVPAT